MKAIILPSNGRPKQLVDLVSTAPGKQVIDVIVENDALSITFFVASLGANAALSVIVEEVGNNSDNVKLVRRLDPIVRPSDNPLTEVINVSGVVRLTVNYSGSVTFDLHGKAVSGAVAALNSVQPVSVDLTDSDKSYREEHMALLCKIHDTLETILNHQRVITSIEKDKGDKY